MAEELRKLHAREIIRRACGCEHAEVREMNPNTPVGCPQCGGQMDLWQAGRRLALTGLFASVTDWIEVDIYSCPACGRLAFFRTNFLPQPKNMCRWSRNQQTWTPPPSTFPVRGAGQMPGLRQGASP